MAQLRPRYDQIKALNTEVVVVSFETGYWAQVWQSETEAPFQLLLDPDRAAYRAFNLQQSWWRSWGPKNLWYYARARMQGRQTHHTGGDTHQLGGDFIVDSAGIIRLAYRSKDPTDRPSATSLLTTITQLQKQA